MDGVPDAPGGLVGAWMNVIVGAAFLVGLPIIVFNQAQAPANVLFAIAALTLAGFPRSHLHPQAPPAARSPTRP